MKHITRDPHPLPEEKIVRPTQMAWLRRSELDQDGDEIWEQPDGTLYAHDPRRGPLMLRVMK